MNQNQPVDDKQIRRYLAAFADGELDVEQSLQVLERMAMDPQTTRRVLHQQQLRRRVGQVMHKSAGEAPAALRDRVRSLAATTGQTGDTASLGGPTLWRKLRRWTPTAIAATLLLAAALLVSFPNDAGTGDPSGNGASGGVDSASASASGGGGGGGGDSIQLAGADRFGQRHVRCSRNLRPLENSARFPEQVVALPDALESYFAEAFSCPPLDLSDLGYAYERTGECGLPGSRSVHIVYRAQPDSGRRDSLSLWITPDTPDTPDTDRLDLDLEEGRLYTAAGEDSAHPVLIWRREDIIYHLVGDSLPQTQTAASQILARN